MALATQRGCWGVKRCSHHTLPPNHSAPNQKNWEEEDVETNNGIFDTMVEDLKKRLNYVEDKTVNATREVYELRNEFFKHEAKNRELIVGQTNKINVVEARVNRLEDEFKTQQGRLWALILVVLSEIIVSVIKLMGHGFF